MTLAKLANRNKSASARSTRTTKRGSASSASDRLTSRANLIRLRDMTIWLCEHNSGGARWLERYAGHSHGWWEYVKRERWRKIKPTEADFGRVRMLYDALQEHSGMHGRLLELHLEKMEHKARIDMIDAEFTRMLSRMAGAR